MLQAKFLLDGWKLNSRGVYCIKNHFHGVFIPIFRAYRAMKKIPGVNTKPIRIFRRDR